MHYSISINCHQRLPSSEVRLGIIARVGPIRLIRQLEGLVQELEALQELQGQLEESQSEERQEGEVADLEGDSI